MPSTPTSSTATVATSRPDPIGIRCKCGAPAERLTVKKDGPTRGRHFFKCHGRVCDFFQWDPEEVKQLQETMLSQARKREPEISPEVCRLKEELEVEKKKLEQERVQMVQAQHTHELDAQQQLEMVMEHANQKHNELLEEATRRNEELLQASNQQHQQLMEVSNMAYQSHVDQLQHQLCWLTTLVGEERIQEVMNDPRKYAEASAHAKQLKEAMGPSSGNQP